MRKYIIPALLAPIAFGIGLYLTVAPLPLFAKDIGGWSTTAGNNNDAPPDGHGEGDSAGSMNNTLREVMASIKEWYDDTQPSVASTGSGGSFSFAASQSIGSYATGQVFSFIASFPITGSATLNVDGVGAKTIVKQGGTATLAADDIVTGQHVVVSYDATGDRWQLLSPPSTDNSGLSSPIGASDGGTGLTTITDGGVMLGSGTGTVTAMSVLADGEIIVGDGTTDPVALAAFESSTGDLAVTAGGTGVGTLTDGGVLLGSGTGDVTAMSVLSDGEIIVGDGTTDPVAESGATARTSLGAAGTADANTFTNSQTVDAAGGLFKLRTDGDTASNTMGLDFENDSTTRTGMIFGTGDSSTSTVLRIMSEGNVQIHAGETGFIAGTARLTVHASDGVTVGSPTGGAQGAGTINATAIYDDGVLLAPAVTPSVFTSAQQTITSAGELQIAHSLSATPDNVQLYLVNVTAQGGYAPGSTVYLGPAYGGANTQGTAVTADATNIGIRYGSEASNAFVVMDFSNGNLLNATNGSWKLVIKAQVY